MSLTSDTLRDLVKKIFHKKKQSVWVLIKGKKQSGKTNFALRLMEILYEENLADGFGSNVKTLEAPFDVDFIEDFPTLQKRCQMLNPDPEKYGINRYFYFCSEMGKAFPQDQPWRNTEFIGELQLVRKIGLNWIGDGINRIDKRIDNATHFDGYFKKLSITMPDLAIFHDYGNDRVTEIEGIKPTQLKYNTWESCNFYMEPHSENDKEIPLNKDHLIVKQYLDADCSLKKTALHRQTLKRAKDNVLKYYWKYYLEPQPVEDKANAEPSSEE